MDNDNTVRPAQFQPELMGDSFKVKDLPVNYHGKKVVPNFNNSYRTPNESKSKVHQGMARILTPVTALFESYSKKIYDENGSLVNGKDLKNRIVDFTKNLKEVNKAINQKEKEIAKLEKDTKRRNFHQGRIDANKQAIQELKNDWNKVKNNIEGLRKGLEGTFFDGSTVLVRLNREENKLNAAFSRNNSPIASTETKVEVAEPKLSTEERALEINRNMDAICRILLEHHYDEKILTDLRELSSRNTDDKSILSMISARGEVVNKIKSYQYNYFNLLENVEMNYAFDDKVLDSEHYIDRIRTLLDDINSPKLRDDGLARAYREVIKKDLEIVRDKLKILIGASQDAENMHTSVEQMLAELNAPQQRSE